MNLNKKVALVTGAAQGIGKAAALVLASYGADIVCADLNETGATKTADQVKSTSCKCMVCRLDVSSQVDIHAAVEKAIVKFGRIDILVNAAGIAIQATVEDTSEAIWDKTMNINAKGVFLCCQAVAKHMKERKSGKIVNISSRAAKIGETGNGAYCSSKAAVSMLTQVLALEYAPYGINVNAICPGLVDTEMIQEAVIRFSQQNGMTPAEYQKQWTDQIPLKRMARPEEVGEFIAFLASDKADYLTGSAYNIDGGAVRI